MTVFGLGFFLVYELTVNSNSAFGLPSWLSLVAGRYEPNRTVIGASDTPGSMGPKSSTHSKSVPGSCSLEVSQLENI